MWPRNAVIAWIGLLLMLASVLLAASMSTSMAAAQDAQDPSAATPVALEGVQPETCSVCHKEGGAKHQASYDELYQDGVIQVTDLAYAFSGPDTSTVTFKMTKDGEPFDARKSDSLSIYFAPYTGEEFQFEPAAERLSLKGS